MECTVRLQPPHLAGSASSTSSSSAAAVAAARRRCRGGTSSLRRSAGRAAQQSRRSTTPVVAIATGSGRRRASVGKQKQEQEQLQQGGAGFSSWGYLDAYREDAQEGGSWDEPPSLLASTAQIQVPPPEQQTDKDANSRAYYANVGDAIRTLRTEYPYIFKRDLTYDIYRKDITFCDPRNAFSGIRNYRTIFWSLRFFSKVLFKSAWVEVMRIWQPSGDVIAIRWTVHGTSRVPWEAQGRFEGNSYYKLDREGKIFEHKVDNVILGPTRFQQIPLLNLAGLNNNTCRQPTPTLYILMCFSWVRLYFASWSAVLLADALGGV
eukprot:jgi/Chlat1/528/Chrsp103S01112